MNMDLSLVDLVPKRWQEHELLKCVGKPYVPKDLIDGKWICDLMAHGCGGCLFCRGRRAAFLSTRLFIEAQNHSEMSFITLTYEPIHEPEGRFVVKDHVVRFIKRLRERVEYYRGAKWFLRLHYIGEYGGRLGRPHYHLLVYGADPNTIFGRKLFSQIVDDEWGYGFVQVKSAHENSFSYLAKYQAKGLTRVDDPALRGRPPQFSNGSRRPGIGVPALKRMAASVLSVPFARERVFESGIVPHSVMHERKEKFIGGDAMRLLRMMCGVPYDVDENRKFLDKVRSREMYRLAIDDYFRSGEADKDVVGVANRIEALLKAYCEPYLVQRLARDKIFASRGAASEPF